MGRDRPTVQDAAVAFDSSVESESAQENTIRFDLTPLAKQMRHAEEGGKQAYLLFLDGMNVGRVIQLDDQPLVLGKASSCDVILDDDGVSRIHAKIQYIGHDRIVVQDMSSTNGTFISGERIEKAILLPGEKILFGRRTMVQFVLWDKLDQLYQQELYESCPRDGLTGIHNRKYIKKRIGTDLSYARRHHIPYTVILIDINDFNAINKKHGPHTGDQILVMLSQTISNMIRNEDVFGRFGNDEFVILAQGIDQAGGVMLAKRICKGIAGKTIKALDESGEQLQISVSIGVVTVTGSQEASRQKVITTAHQQLIAAKENIEERISAAIIE